MAPKTYHVTNDKQANYALAKAIRGDVLDFNGTFSPVKVAKSGVTLDGLTT
jgi:hypothetical protein